MKYKKLTITLIIMMILSLGGIAATLTYAKMSTTTQISGGTPPSLPNQSNSNQNQSNTTNDNQSNSDQNQSNNTDSNQTNTSQNQSNNQSNSNNQAPANMNNQTQSNGLSSMHILVIGECFVVFVASSLVLIATKAGRRSIKESFNKPYKIIIVIMSTAMLTTALTYGTTVLSNKYLLDNKVQLQGSTPPSMPSQTN